MNIKRIASIINMILTVLIILLGLLWAGSFLSEWRPFMGIIWLFVVFFNAGAMAVEWIYGRGEKASRKMTK